MAMAAPPMAATLSRDPRALAAHGNGRAERRNSHAVVAMTVSHEFAPTQNPKGTGSPIHIAFGVDTRFAPAMGVTITSILANNPHINIVFHVITTHIRRDDLQRLQNLAEQHAAGLQLHTIDSQTFHALPDPGRFSYATYNRLLISNLLRGVTQKALYLDSDIVCLGDISELNALDMGDAIVAAVMETPWPYLPQHMAMLGTPQAKSYFNCGVLYIDLARWDEHDISRKAMDLLIRRPGLPYPDQDALNILLADKVTSIDKKWNTIWGDGSDPTYRTPAETVFLHYALDKPWHEWSPNFHDPSFKKYRAQSPWAGSPMYDPRHDYPRTRGDKKTYARNLLRTGDVLGASQWYLKYLATRKTAGEL